MALHLLQDQWSQSNTSLNEFLAKFETKRIFDHRLDALFSRD